MILGDRRRDLFQLLDQALHAVGIVAVGDQDRILARDHHEVLDAEQRHQRLFRRGIGIPRVQKQRVAVRGISRRIALRTIPTPHARNRHPTSHKRPASPRRAWSFPSPRNRSNWHSPTRTQSGSSVTKPRSMPAFSIAACVASTVFASKARYSSSKTPARKTKLPEFQR